MSFAGSAQTGGGAAGQGRPDYVTMVSNDGFEFHILRSAAEVSGAIRRMLDPLSTRLAFGPLACQ